MDSEENITTESLANLLKRESENINTLPNDTNNRNTHLLKPINKDSSVPHFMEKLFPNQQKYENKEKFNNINQKSNVNSISSNPNIAKASEAAMGMNAKIQQIKAFKKSTISPGAGGNDELGIFLPLSKKGAEKFSSLCSSLKDLTILQDPEQLKTSIMEQEKITRIFGKKKENDLQANLEIKEQFRKLKYSSQVYDSISEDEDLIVENVPWYIIKPLSTKKLIFDGIILIITITLVILLPLEIAFYKQWENFKKMASFLNDLGLYIYWMDLFLFFITGYLNANDKLIYKFKEIPRRYLIKWIVIDFICAFPYQWMFSIKKSKDPNIIFKQYLVDLIKLIKVLKIGFNNKAADYLLHKAIETSMGQHLTIIVSLFSFCLIMHITSCIYIFIGEHTYPNWIIVTNLDYSTAIELYIASFYFIAVTIFSVGYGDILSNNIPERIFNIILLVFGMIIYSWFVSALSEYTNELKLKNLEQHEEAELQKKLKVIDDVELKTRNVPNGLFTKIRKHLFYSFIKDRKLSSKIFESLPLAVKNELIMAIYKPTVDNFIFFRKFRNIDFIVQVIEKFHSAMFFKNDRLITEGNMVEEMFFIKNGKLALEIPLTPDIKHQIEKINSLKGMFSLNVMEKETNRGPKEDDKFKYVKILEIRKNEHFGDILMFVNKSSPFSLKVISKKVEMYLLRKKDAINIVVSFPIIWKNILSSSMYNMKQIEALSKKILDFFYSKNKEYISNLKQTILYETDRLKTTGIIRFPNIASALTKHGDENDESFDDDSSDSPQRLQMEVIKETESEKSSIEDPKNANKNSNSLTDSNFSNSIEVEEAPKTVSDNISEVNNELSSGESLGFEKGKCLKIRKFQEGLEQTADYFELKGNDALDQEEPESSSNKKKDKKTIMKNEVLDNCNHVFTEISNNIQSNCTLLNDSKTFFLLKFESILERKEEKEEINSRLNNIMKLLK